MTANQNTIQNLQVNDKNQTNNITDSMATVGFNSLNPLVQNIQFGASIPDNNSFYDNTASIQQLQNIQLSQQLNNLNSNLGFGNTNLGYTQQTQNYQPPYDQNTLHYNQLPNINTSSILNSNIRHTPNLTLNNLALNLNGSSNYESISGINSNGNANLNILNNITQQNKYPQQNLYNQNNLTNGPQTSNYTHRINKSNKAKPKNIMRTGMVATSNLNGHIDLGRFENEPSGLSPEMLEEGTKFFEENDDIIEELVKYNKENFIDKGMAAYSDGHLHNDFSEYEWMIDMEKFDEEELRKIEEEDDIDEIYYWNPEEGCEGSVEGKAEVMAKHGKNSRNNSKERCDDRKFGREENKKRQPSNSSHGSAPAYTNNPLSNMDLGSPQKFDNFGLKNKTRKPNQFNFTNGQFDVEKLTSGLNNVDIHRFSFNPNAFSFVPQQRQHKM